MRSNDEEGLFYFEVLYLLGLLADVSQDAAISVQDLAVDKVGSMGGQEHAGANHVLGDAPAACGGLGADEGIEGMAAAIGLDLAQGSGLSGGNLARAHAVALDVVLAALCHALGNGEADAVCAAGDQGNLVLQIKCSKIHKENSFTERPRTGEPVRGLVCA